MSALMLGSFRMATTVTSPLVKKPSLPLDFDRDDSIKVQ